MPTRSAVRSRGSLPMTSSSVCAACSSSVCCDSASLRSAGGKRSRPTSISNGSAIDWGGSPAIVDCPCRKAASKAAVLAAPPAVTVWATTAISTSTHSLGPRAGPVGPRRADGTHSSTRRCALLPPNPKLLMAARRGPSLGHGSAVMRRRSGPAISSSGSSAWRVGGRTCARIAHSTLMSAAAPDAVMR